MSLERKKRKRLSENKAGNQDASVFPGGSSWALHSQPDGWDLPPCLLLLARTCESSLLSSFTSCLKFLKFSVSFKEHSELWPWNGRTICSPSLLSSLAAFTLRSPAPRKFPVGKDWWPDRTRWFPSSVLTPHSPGSIRRAHFGSSKSPLEGSIFLLKTKVDSDSQGVSKNTIGEADGNPHQCSWLGNPVDRGAGRATVCGITKSQTRLSD